MRARQLPILCFILTALTCQPPGGRYPAAEPGELDAEITELLECAVPTETACAIAGKSIARPPWNTDFVVRGIVQCAQGAQWMIEWESCRRDEGQCAYTPRMGPWSPFTARRVEATAILRIWERHWIILRAEAGTRFVADTLIINPPHELRRGSTGGSNGTTELYPNNG